MKSALNRQVILARYAMTPSGIAICLTLVDVVLQDDTLVNLGFEVAAIRSTQGSGIEFKQSMNGFGWDPTLVGIVQPIITDLMVVKHKECKGDMAPFYEWCVAEVIASRLRVAVVDGVHRTIHMKEVNPNSSGTLAYSYSMSHTSSSLRLVSPVEPHMPE